MNTMQPVRRLDDETSHELAIDYLAEVLGMAAPVLAPEVRWDPEHHLQGHLVVRGEELVVIAVRTTDHTPVVLSEADWDEFRRRGTPVAA